MLSRIRTRVVCSIVFCALIALTGCGSTSCYVLKDSEIIYLDKGETITAPHKGIYMSENAVKRVLDVKIIDTNLK